MDDSQKILDYLSNDMTFGVSAQGSLAFNDDLKWEINNGYIAIGVQVGVILAIGAAL